MSFTCIPHTVHSIKPRSAFQKAPIVYTGRTSLHLLDPVPPYLLRPFRFVVVATFVLWDPERREMGENEVKSLLFIIVVIVYLQYLEERSGKKEKKKFFCHIHYSLALQNRFSLRLL